MQLKPEYKHIVAHKMEEGGQLLKYLQSENNDREVNSDHPPAWLQDFSPRSEDDLALLSPPLKGSNNLEVSHSERTLSPDSPTISTVGTVYKNEGLGDFYADVRDFGHWSRKSGMQLGERPSSPKKHFLGQCEEYGLIPEPLLARVMEESREGIFNIEGYRVGNAIILALAKSISIMAVLEVNIADNRANDDAIAILLRNLNSHEQLGLKILNLSKNKLGRRSVPELARLISSSPALKTVELEGSQINDSALRPIVTSLTERRCAVTMLNLSRNKISDAGAAMLAENLNFMRTLDSIDLSWNQIGWRGGTAFAEALENCRLKKLDISWNALGSSTDAKRSCAKALSTALGGNVSLVHADIGHNNFTASDCSLIAEKLRENHTLMGLHLEGDAKLDASGFLSVIEPNGPDFHKVESHIFTRILRPRIRHKEKWTPVSNCWLCEKWTERLFVWHNEFSPCEGNEVNGEKRSESSLKDVYMCASYDGWAPQLMVLANERDRFVDYRMVPPGEHFYYFIVGDQKMHAADQPILETATLPPKILNRQGPIQVSDDVVLAFGIKDKNGLRQGEKGKVIRGPDSNGNYAVRRLVDETELDNFAAADLRVVPPRIVNRFIEEENEGFPSLQPRLTVAISPQKTGGHQGPWKFENSVFVMYKQDTENLVASAFIKDFTHSNISALKGIKNKPEELEDTKAVLKKHYGMIKGVFKHYSAAFSSEIFNLGANGLNEILNVCQIIEEGTPCNRTEADMAFISCNLTGPKDKKLNPKRALCRFQFLQLMTNLALSKFYKTAIEPTPSAAVERFMSECLARAEWDDGQEFRTKIMYNEEVDEVFKTSNDVLTKVYSENIGEEQGPTEKKTMCVREWQALVDKAGLLDGEIMGDRSCRLCYVRAIETSSDEMNDRLASRKMEIHEFYEAICRVAFQLKSYPNSPMPFVKHLSSVISAFGETLKKKKSTSTVTTDLPIVSSTKSSSRSPRSARRGSRGLIAKDAGGTDNT